MLHLLVELSVSIFTVRINAAPNDRATPTVDQMLVDLNANPVPGQLLAGDENTGLSIFAEVLVKFNEYYYKEIDPKDFYEKLLQGGLPNIDHYTYYFEAHEGERFSQSLKGSFFGIGLQMGEKTEKGKSYLAIMSVIKGSPAEKAGVRSSDRLVWVASDGDHTHAVNVERLPIDKIVDMIRGEKGAPVYIGVIRNGKALGFTIARDEIKTAVVESKIVAPGVGYLTFGEFADEKLLDDIEKAIDNLKAKGMRALILDLRQNPGGLADTAVELDNWFNKGNTETIMTIKGRKVNKAEKGLWLTRGKFKGIPLVVLADGGSASASEIVTAFLKNYCNAIVVGTTTFGKGVGQSVVPLLTGGLLKVTSFEYFVGDKLVKVNGVGVKPTIEVKLTKQVKTDADDTQLQRAILEAQKLVK